MNKFLFILFLFIVLNSYSQQSKTNKLDDTLSLRIETEKFKKNEDWIAVSKIYQELAEKYKRERNFEEAKKNIENSIELNKREANNELLAKDYRLYGNIFNHFQKYESAIEYYQKSISLCEKNDFVEQLGFSIENLASTLFNQGKVEKAITKSLEALDISQEFNLIELELIVLRSLGNHYMSLKQYSKAESRLLEALKLLEQSDVKEDEIDCEIYRYLGLNYSRSQNFDKAFEFNQKAYECYESSGNVMIASDILNTIGATHLRLENYNESLPYFKKGLKISQDIKSKIGENFFNINISSVYINLGREKEAENILLNILTDTINPKHLPKRVEKVVYQNLSELYKNEKDYKTSLFYFEKFKKLEDSLSSESKIKTVTEIETKYQTEKKEKENLQLKADNVQQELQLEKESKRKWYFGVGLLASLITLSVFIFYYKRNKEQKTVIENLQKDLHHRVKNNLAIIDALIDDIKDEFDNEKFKTKLTELQNRIDSINEVHSQLYKNTDVTNLQLKKYVGKLAKNVQQSFSKDNIVIKQHIDGSLQLKADKSFPVGLIINEFLTNSFKYAFDDNTKGVVSISIKEKAKTFILSLSDNGKGLPNNFDISKLDSFGIEVMKLLSKQLKGTFVLDGSKGVNLNIEFPKI